MQTLSSKSDNEKPDECGSVVAASIAYSKTTHRSPLASESRVSGKPAVRSSLSDVRSWPRVSIRSNIDERAYEKLFQKIKKRNPKQTAPFYYDLPQMVRAFNSDEPYIGPDVNYKNSFREMPGMAKRAFRLHKPPD